MKKVIYDEYGSVDVLKLAEADQPVPDNNQILIKVKAVGINPLDWKIFGGDMKMMSGSHFPKGVGIDFSGVVEKTGTAIKNFTAGDEVFGIADVFKGGALAEYIVISEDKIAIKPAAVSFEQAAAMAAVGCSAIEILDHLVKLKGGDEILINGAGGGIGMFAVQLAKKQGAVVTSVVSEDGISAAKKWGSDFIVNHKQTNVLQEKKQYDAVVDLSGKMSFSDAKEIMKSSSTFVTTVPDMKVIAGSFVNDLVSAKKYKYLSLKPSSNDLKALANYVSEGMEIFISKTYPLKSFKEAYTEMPEKSIVGKAVFVV